MDGSNLGEKKKYNLAALAKSKLETTTFIGSLTQTTSKVQKKRCFNIAAYCTVQYLYNCTAPHFISKATKNNKE